VAFEKRLKAVPLQLFTADGTNLGKVTIPGACAFKVKQQVILNSSTAGPLRLEVKRVDGDTVLFVGPIGDHQHKSSILDRTDISAYLIADGASIFAEEQKRPNIPEQEIERLTYEEEPTVARRVVVVDECGDKYGATNRFPVDAVINLDATKLRYHKIFNKLVTTANVEEFVSLPDKTEIITIMVRSNKACKLQYSFVLGESGTKFITIMPGVRKEITNINLVGVTPLYFQLSLTENNGTIVEIETWNS